jgi:acyl-CoA synthetase (AMP-forming)/AMP-acid ligase II
VSHLLHDLFERARREPDAHLATFVDDAGRDVASHTVGSMLERVRRIAGWLRHDVGLAPGARALLLYPPSMAFFEVYAACLYAGVVAVPAYPPDPLRPGAALGLLSAIAERSKADALLSPADYRRAVQVGNVGGFLTRRAERWPDLPWHVSDAAARSTAACDLHPAAPGDVAVLQFTSGSTATPKGVRLTHANLAHQIAFCAAELGFTPSSRLVMWVPPYHDLGLVSGMTAVLAGCGRLWMTSPASFLRDPGLWFDLVHRVRGTHTAAPNFGYALVTRRTSPERRAGWDLSSLSVVMSAAEPIVPATMDRFFEAFAPTGLSPSAFRPAYGLAEHTVGVTIGRGARLTFDREGAHRDGLVRPDAEADQTLVGCGRPARDVRVAIVREGVALRDGEIGEIWVSSPSVADGYEGSREGFDATLAGEPGPWLRTGDHGFLYAGELFVTGRLKDLIVLRGRKLHPEDVEQEVRGAHPDLRPGGIASFSVPDGDSESLVVLAECSRAEAAAEAAAAIQHVLGASFSVQGRVVLLPPHAVPKTTSGKVRRAAARDAWLAGELPSLLSSRVDEHVDVDARPLREVLDEIAPDERVEHVARQVLVRLAARHSVAGLAAAGLDVPVHELGVDSVMAAELLVDLEAWSGTSIAASIVADKPTPRVLASRVLTAMDVPHPAVEAPPRPPLAPHPARPPHRAMSPATTRVAVAGAGVAGLTSALELARLGYRDITVFEAAREVGGKVLSVPMAGRVVELGQMFMPSCCREMLAITEEVGLSLLALPPDHRTWSERHGLQHGPAAGPGLVWMQRLVRAAKPPSDGELPLPIAGLDVSFEDFVAERGIRVHPSFDGVWLAMGYGVDHAVPMAYVVPYLQLYGSTLFNGAVPEGNSEVWRRVAARLRDRFGVTIRTETRVRALDVQRVVTAQGAEPFDEVVVTLPPRALRRVLPDGDPLRPILDRFTAIDLLIVGLHVEGLPDPLSLVVPGAKGGDLAALRLRDGVGCGMAYLGGPGVPEPVGPDAAVERIVAQVERMGGRVVEVGPRRVWDYFPHVRGDVGATLAAVEARQGVDHRWYAGSWLAFEMTEHTLRHAQHLVRTAFDPAFGL